MKHSNPAYRVDLRRKVQGLPGFNVVTALALLFGITAASALPIVEVGAVTAAAGSTAVLPVSYQSQAGIGIATLVVRLSIPDTQVTLLDVVPDASVSAVGKTLDFEAQNNQVAIAVFGGKSDIISGGLCLLLVRLHPDLPAGSTVTVSDAGSQGSDKQASAVAVDVQEGVISVAVALNPHHADSNADWSVSLPELLRIIQFYNVEAHHCDAATADGFAPGPGDTGCPTHNADYNPADWKIAFEELLRVIQLYNAPYGVYHSIAGTEDGFSPGPFGILYDKRFAHLK